MYWMRGLVRIWAILSLIWIPIVFMMTLPWIGFMVAAATATPAVPVLKENRFSEFVDETEGPWTRYRADGGPVLTIEQAVAVNAARARLALDRVVLGFREGAHRDL